MLLRRTLSFKMLQNLHEYHWENTPHCAINRPKDCPLLRNQHPRNQCDWSTKIFESIMNSSGGPTSPIVSYDWKYSRIWNGRKGTEERLSAINVQIMD